jgi:large subunit ribosomal protein L10
MAHVAQWKKDRVGELTEMIRKNPVVAIVDIRGIPAPQMQQMRLRLRGKAVMMMTRNTLLNIAIDEVTKEKPGLDSLKGNIGGQCAIITTTMNPFKLFNEMERTKTKAAAKSGDIAPEDIAIQEGETPFKPGPIVGELQKAGIPAGIESGKVVFKKDKVLVKKGDRIPEEIAKILPRLEIFPMTVGLDLKAAYEDGIIFKRDVLQIPPDYYPSMLATAARNAMSLCVTIVYVTPQTITPLLAKAYREASALSVAAAFPTKDNIKALLAKADANMLALASRIPGFEDDRVKKRLTAAPVSQKAVAQKTEDSKEKKEEKKEKEVSEEEAAAGLSALFG